VGEGRILVVDDEKKIVKLVKAYLEKEGYATLEAYDGASALELWRREAPDLIVLDILMPGVDGLEFLREVRQTSQVPVIMLSARSQEVDKLVGLGLGADDYVTKPFSPRELVARIRAVLRRHRPGAPGDETPIHEGPLAVYPDRHTVTAAGEEVLLTATEFAMLRALASSPGRVYTRGQLIQLAQGDFFEGYERTVDTHVKNVRRKIAQKAEGWSFIETVHGVGYRFVAKEEA
jgi:two-component system OmpR family response regulator